MTDNCSARLEDARIKVLCELPDGHGGSHQSFTFETEWREDRRLNALGVTHPREIHFSPTTFRAVRPKEKA